MLAVLLTVCIVGTPPLAWITPRNSASALARLNSNVTPPLYTVDLDMPAATRWDHVAAAFKDKMPLVVAYLESVVPPWALPLIEMVAQRMPGYFDDFGDEMVGLSKALHVKSGLLVLLNLIMQVESVGINCSNWNVTGPTRKDDPGCADVDPTQTWCYCRAAREAGATPAPLAAGLGTEYYEFGRHATDGGPGLCTSIVAQAPDGSIVHGRNLDWNLPAAVRVLIIDIEFVRGGRRLFRGTGAAGFVGVFNGMAYRSDNADGSGWSASINARKKGGKLLINLLQALLHKSITPCQHLRRTLEATSDFEGALRLLGSGAQIDDSYFIVAGTQPGEGAVIARDRNAAADTWRLNMTDSNGWYRLQTNYDHWQPVPAADDRRSPGYAHMDAMSRANVSEGAIWDVLKAWPTFNGHTDYSAFIVPARAEYHSTVWMS